MTIYLDAKFDKQNTARLADDPGDCDSRPQMLELQRSVITSLKPGVPPRPIFDLTISVGDGDRAEDLTFHGISRDALKNLGVALINLSEEPIDGEA